MFDLLRYDSVIYVFYGMQIFVFKRRLEITMGERTTPLTVAGLIAALKELPQDADVYFSGTVSDRHCFTSINAPVAKINRVRSYQNSDRKYVTLYGFQKGE